MASREDQLLARVAELEKINGDQAATIKGMQAAMKDSLGKDATPTIYVDGSCIGNPGPGGWGLVVVRYGVEVHREKSERYPKTTNNRMEMEGIIAALRWCRAQGYLKTVIRSDSKLAVNVAAGHWRAKANLDLVRAIGAAEEGLKIKYRWIKGHANNLWNDLADKLAREAAGLPAKESPAMLRRKTREKAAREIAERGARRERGTFGPASAVRHIDPAEYQEGK